MAIMSVWYRDGRLFPWATTSNEVMNSGQRTVHPNIGVRTGVAGYDIATPAGCKHSQFLFFLTKDS